MPSTAVEFSKFLEEQDKMAGILKALSTPTDELYRDWVVAPAMKVAVVKSET